MNFLKRSWIFIISFHVRVRCISRCSCFSLTNKNQKMTNAQSYGELIWQHSRHELLNSTIRYGLWILNYSTLPDEFHHTSCVNWKINLSSLGVFLLPLCSLFARFTFTSHSRQFLRPPLAMDIRLWAMTVVETAWQMSDFAAAAGKYPSESAWRTHSCSHIAAFLLNYPATRATSTNGIDGVDADADACHLCSLWRLEPTRVPSRSQSSVRSLDWILTMLEFLWKLEWINFAIHVSRMTQTNPSSMSPRWDCVDINLYFSRTVKSWDSRHWQKLTWPH